MTRDAIEKRMLSGQPFTYSGLCSLRKNTFEVGSPLHGDHDRLIDRTIQKLRRKGLIAFKREKGLVIWSPVSK